MVRFGAQFHAQCCSVAISLQNCFSELFFQNCVFLKILKMYADTWLLYNAGYIEYRVLLDHALSYNGVTAYVKCKMSWLGVGYIND